MRTSVSVEDADSRESREAVTEVAAGIGMNVAGRRARVGERTGTRRSTVEHVHRVVEGSAAESELGFLFCVGQDPEEVGHSLTERALSLLVCLEVAPPEQIDDCHCQDGNATHE
jgi:hypothetical protein